MTSKESTFLGGTNLGTGHIAFSSTGSKSLFTIQPYFDWTKPPLSLSELKILCDCSNNTTAFLQAQQDSFPLLTT